MSVVSGSRRASVISGQQNIMKIVIAANSLEEMAISLHARIMTPNPESHLVTVGRPPVGVDVLPVVVVVALEKAHYRSPFAHLLPLRLHRFSQFRLTMCCRCISCLAKIQHCKPACGSKPSLGHG